MNKQNNGSFSSATRTFVGISMMALAMVTFTACGKKSDDGKTDTSSTSSAGEPNNTASTTGGAPTTDGNVTAPAGGAGITGNQNGVAVSLPYARLTVNTSAKTPSEAYALEFLSYNPYCFYAANPDPKYTTTPNSFDAMAVYLGSTAPVAGTYTVGGTTTAIDPNSGFEITTGCVATSAKLGATSTVALTAVDATAKTATGTVTVTLSDGTALAGSFTTVSACDAPTPAATAAAPVCTTITYK